MGRVIDAAMLGTDLASLLATLDGLSERALCVGNRRLSEVLHATALLLAVELQREIASEEGHTARALPAPPVRAANDSATLW